MTEQELITAIETAMKHHMNSPLVDHYRTVMSLIGLLFLSIIGVYIFTFKWYRDIQKSLADVYTTFNLRKKECKGEYVPIEVCNVLHTELKETVGEISSDVKKLLVKVG